MNSPLTNDSRPNLPGAYLAAPASGKGPGVLVLHAWWGLTPFIREFCDLLAGHGYVVLAPDLYRGAVATTVAQAEQLRGRLKRDTAMREVSQAAQALQAQAAPGHAGIGIVGFSLGGYYALWLAEQPAVPVAAAVIFYASRGGEYNAGCPAFQFHLAETDPYVSASGAKSLQKALHKAGREVDFHVYPGTTHWFFESDRPDAFRADAAAQAWERLLAFLGKHLVQ